MSTANIVVGVVSTNTIKVGEYQDAEETAVSLGETDGGIEIIKTSEVKEIFVDQYLGAVAAPTIKEGCTVKVNVAAATLANMAVAFGYPTTAVTGSTSFSFGGLSDVYDYKTVYLNVAGPGPGTRKYTLHKCKIKGDSSQKYVKDGVTMVPLEIIVLCDTAQSSGSEFMTVADTGLDTTAPTIVLTTPADGGTVTKDAKGTVLWTVTETNGIDASTCIYGNTFNIVNITTPGSATLVAGTIAVSVTAKTITFTPTANWTASDSLQAIVTTGFKDAAGNALAATKIEQFSVTA